MKENHSPVHPAKTAPVDSPPPARAGPAAVESQPAPSGLQIRAARTLSRLTRLLVRSYGEKKGRTILVQAIQQRLRSGKDIRDIVAARVAPNGITRSAAPDAGDGTKA